MPVRMPKPRPRLIRLLRVSPGKLYLRVNLQHAITQPDCRRAGKSRSGPGLARRGEGVPVRSRRLVRPRYQSSGQGNKPRLRPERTGKRGMVAKLKYTTANDAWERQKRYHEQTLHHQLEQPQVKEFSFVGKLYETKCVRCNRMLCVHGGWAGAGVFGPAAYTDCDTPE